MGSVVMGFDSPTVGSHRASLLWPKVAGNSVPLAHELLKARGVGLARPLAASVRHRGRDGLVASGAASAGELDDKSTPTAPVATVPPPS